MSRRVGRVGVNWETPEHFQWEHVRVEVLMDIRDELQKLNAILGCRNFTSLPQVLQRIDRRLARKINLKEKE